MRKLIFLFVFSFVLFSCEEMHSPQELQNNTAKQEQARVEKNQANLNDKQPSPNVSWSMERDNLIKRFKLMNDRSVIFYMYIFNYGVSQPIGYYQVNKVSSVNSQLTNPEQIVLTETYDTPGEFYGRTAHVLPSPAEDGSYGTNGDGVFGFTPDDIYIEHNMQYIVSTVPLQFKNVPNIAEIDIKTAKELKNLMDKLN